MRLLITGTDTGVGKTFITYNLAKELKERGYKVGCLKPVETYVREVPEDGSLLSKATGQSVNEIVPVRFSLPLAPYAATLEEGRDFALEELGKHYEELSKKYKFLLVEGAGGIAVPIKKNYTYANLARDWKLKVLIVGRAGLGTINHTFLTWYYAKATGLEVIGIILNGFTGEDVSERTNPQIIEEMTGIKPYKVPRIQDVELPKDIRTGLADYVLSRFTP
ncbi:dethiobiotin synthase [Aquifex aeolicus]|uniref:ATP-dependent dethiobiotin synthetase BioD n=1 Tax=Aquifex aeolicus (strain VF5) TaxID=224324 RepID=BIOD_AQUAE|nr:dethiobiotin synthase [Aquifex aeolicus]O66832.1 RecName: Full=ATP-dependent dethiobiotin synthetase BioD; AltName: Full=DTB synthetase; Short=DTBS; AltName: Full=Dethiobiotin synthase [Aquifex aeolicus VF5]AAC06785.1 dethiobiotin synthetase [Aquifex aeolicus VF5]